MLDIGMFWGAGSQCKMYFFLWLTVRKSLKAPRQWWPLGWSSWSTRSNSVSNVFWQVWHLRNRSLYFQESVAVFWEGKTLSSFGNSWKSHFLLKTRCLPDFCDVCFSAPSVAAVTKCTLCSTLKSRCFWEPILGFALSAFIISFTPVPSMSSFMPLISKLLPPSHTLLSPRAHIFYTPWAQHVPNGTHYLSFSTPIPPSQTHSSSVFLSLVNVTTLPHVCLRQKDTLSSIPSFPSSLTCTRSPSPDSEYVFLLSYRSFYCHHPCPSLLHLPPGSAGASNLLPGCLS